MRRMTHILSVCLATMAFAADAQTFQAAMTTLELTERDRTLSGFLWYPTEDTGPTTLDFESKVWVGTSVVRDAEPARGPFPLVVLSHGIFGNAYNQAWLASALAQRGYAVAAIDHPGTSTWSQEPDLSRQLWERPKDISRVIDHALAAPALTDLVDRDHIYMAGHSLGGFTAVALAGARFDATQFQSFCDATPGELVCRILMSWRVAQTPEDQARMEADLSDSRIKAFAVFDLGGTQSFSEKSLATLNRPMLVFGAQVMNSGLTLDIESRALVAAAPASITQYIEPEDLSHFDFLGLCKPGGLELLAREEPGDEIICDNGGIARAAKHEMIINHVERFFRLE
ncbi:MAG: alpha/beta hydrolase family protein [Roseobacter sp.]